MTFVKGKKFSAEHRRKISEANKGKVYSEETLAKMRESAKKRAIENPKELPKGMKLKTEHVFVNGVESKACCVCKNIKPLTDFGKNKHARNGTGLSYGCKACEVARKKHRYRTDPKVKERDTVGAVERRRRNKLSCIEYKGSKCQTCGFTLITEEGKSNAGAFQFHHRNPAEKEFTITERQYASLETLKPELDKCDLLCANCHAVFHDNDWKQNGRYVKDSTDNSEESP